MGIKYSRYIKGFKVLPQRTTKEESWMILNCFKFQAFFRARNFKFSRNFKTSKGISTSIFIFPVEKNEKLFSFSLFPFSKSSVGSIDNRLLHSVHFKHLSIAIRFEESIKGWQFHGSVNRSFEWYYIRVAGLLCRAACHVHVRAGRSGCSSSRSGIRSRSLVGASTKSKCRQREKTVWMGYRSVVCGPAVFLVDRNASWGGPEESIGQKRSGRATIGARNGRGLKAVWTYETEHRRINLICRSVNHREPTRSAEKCARQRQIQFWITLPMGNPWPRTLRRTESYGYASERDKLTR